MRENKGNRFVEGQQPFLIPHDQVIRSFVLLSFTSYRIYYQVSAFTSGIVANEYYLINSRGEACTSADSVSNVFTFGTPVDTGITLGEGIDNAKDLYLKIALSNVAGKSGTSTLTILGEKP